MGFLSKALAGEIINPDQAMSDLIESESSRIALRSCGGKAVKAPTRNGRKKKKQACFPRGRC